MKCPSCGRDCPRVRKPFGMEHKPGVEMCDECIGYDEAQAEPR